MMTVVDGLSSLDGCVDDDSCSTKLATMPVKEKPFQTVSVLCVVVESSRVKLRLTLSLC